MPGHHHLRVLGKPMRTNYHTDQRPSYECSARAPMGSPPRPADPSPRPPWMARRQQTARRARPRRDRTRAGRCDEVTDRHRRISRAAELAVERARYEADRAERAFCQVEPENRLVARTWKPAGKPHSPPWPKPSKPQRHPGRPPAASPAGRAGEPGRRPARTLAGTHHQQQGPQTAAAHPDRRCHPAPRNRHRQGTDRDPLAHRRHRGTRRGPAAATRPRPNAAPHRQSSSSASSVPPPTPGTWPTSSTPPG